MFKFTLKYRRLKEFFHNYLHNPISDETRGWTIIMDIHPIK